MCAAACAQALEIVVDHAPVDEEHERVAWLDEVAAPSGVVHLEMTKVVVVVARARAHALHLSRFVYVGVLYVW